MVFTSTTTWKSKNLILFNKEYEHFIWVFLLSYFVNNFLLILCILIREFMQSINIQVGLNIIYTYIVCVNYRHIYTSTSLHHWTFILQNDIGDASSCLRGSTSSFTCRRFNAIVSQLWFWLFWVMFSNCD